MRRFLALIAAGALALGVTIVAAPSASAAASGSIQQNSNGTLSLTYSGFSGSVDVYFCANNTSVASCNPTNAQYTFVSGMGKGAPASPATITSGMTIYTGSSGGYSATTLAEGTYTVVLREVPPISDVASLEHAVIGAMPTPTSEKPGTPGKPTAVAGVGAATVSVVAPTTGGTPVTYTVTSSPDAKTCTVTVPATSCEVTGLTNGKAYTFTSTATNADGTSDASAASDAVTPTLKPNTPATPPAYAKTSSIAHPGVSVLLKKAVVTPSGAAATPRVRFVEYVQGLRPHGDTGPVSTKLGTYKVTKSGKVIVDVKSKQPMTIIMTLRAPATAEYAAYKSVKTWVLK